MKKKMSLILSVTLAALMMLAACSPAEAPPTAPAAADPGSPSPDPGSPSPAPSPAPPLEKPVHLVYWSMWNNIEPQALVLEQAVRDFEGLNPGVTVEIIWAGRETRQTLAPAIDGGTQIDIFDEDTERVIGNWGQYMLDLESYYDQVYPTTRGLPYKDVVMPALQSLSRSIWPTGGLYTVGYQPFGFFMMYNQDHFAKAGISSVPTTWDDFLAACEALKNAGFIPLTSDNEYISGLFGYHLGRLKGPDFGTELLSDDSGALWDDPAVLEAARALETLAANGYIDPRAESNIWPSAQQDLALGEVSMYLNGTWLINEVMGTTGPGFPWGTFNYPAVPLGATGIEAANFGSQVFAINKDSANPDVAFALIVHLTTGEWDARLSEGTFGAPVDVINGWPLQMADAKAVFESLTTPFPWVGGVEGHTDRGPVVRENVQRLAGGTITAEQFIANCRP